MNPPTDLTPEELAARFADGGPLIGLDLGAKTIGVAVSDAGWRVATPLETIRRSKFSADCDRLLRHADDRGAVAVVLGLPLNMDGSEGPRVQATRAFRRNLAGRTALPVVYWDERLSTVAVERTMLAADASRKRRADAVDKLAAAFILQGLLDRLTALREGQRRAPGSA